MLFRGKREIIPEFGSWKKRVLVVRCVAFDLWDAFYISSRIIVSIATSWGNNAGEIKWCETVDHFVILQNVIVAATTLKSFPSRFFVKIMDAA